MFRALRPSRWFVQRDILLLVRSFPSERVRLTRRRIIGVTAMGQPNFASDVIFDGEALVVPAGGMVDRLGIGMVEQDSPVILIPGFYDIRQGDFLDRTGVGPGGSLLDRRIYVVGYNASAWQDFMVVTLKNYQQGT